MTIPILLIQKMKLSNIKRKLQDWNSNPGITVKPISFAFVFASFLTLTVIQQRWSSTWDPVSLAGTQLILLQSCTKMLLEDQHLLAI